MEVVKRDGSSEPVKLDKITARIKKQTCEDKRGGRPGRGVCGGRREALLRSQEVERGHRGTLAAEQGRMGR